MISVFVSNEILILYNLIYLILLFLLTIDKVRCMWLLPLFPHPPP